MHILFQRTPLVFLRFSRLRPIATMSTSAPANLNPENTRLPPSSIPILNTLSSLRQWRNQAFADGKSVGFVPTMGALHDGHLSLVKHSLAANDLTILSIFVNPTQFAPHEDLSTYPRTLNRDLELLTAISVPSSESDTCRTPAAVFLPSVGEMYPSSVSQNVQEQKGTFVEVKGFGDQMEGRSRPTFFRGVATVVTKLFNAVQPTHAYFGQKDIQQGLILRRMVSDLLMTYPSSQTLHIVPSARDPSSGLALSSRNAYLTPLEHVFAPTLYRMLRAGEQVWDAGGGREDAVNGALEVYKEALERAKVQGVVLELDYVEVNDPWTFEAIEGRRGDGGSGSAFLLSGALKVGRTRLIDNIILGDSSKILY